VVAFVEQDEYCQKVLKKHWADVPIINDIKEFRYDKAETIDLLTGGFPCPAFSRSGKQGGFEQDDLFYELIRVVRESRPTFIIIENVEGVTKWAEEIRYQVKASGYIHEDIILDARDFGIPQARRRYFGLGIQRGKLPSPQYIRRVQGVKSEDIPRIQPNTKNTKRRWTSTIGTKEEWRTIFSNCRRSGTINGIPNRMDRLKALGNAIVPQCVMPIMRVIREIDDYEENRRGNKRRKID
jgi:DNA (cytosine-5)-methyltransferase 1